jgi:ribonuclease HI
MSGSTYRRLRTPDGTGITVRESGREIRLSVGQGQRLRCNTTEAWALLAALADTLGTAIDMAGAPDWVIETPIEVSDK